MALAPSISLSRIAPLTGRAWTLRSETLALAVSLYFTLFLNRSFWQAVQQVCDTGSWHGILLVASLFVALTALTYLVLVVGMTRRSARPLVAVLLVATAIAAHFMDHYGVYLDPSMLRNALATDSGEAGDLLTWALLGDVALHAALPLWLLSQVTIARRPPLRAFAFRLATLGLALAAGLAAVLLSYQDLASLMRNHKEVRYLVTPGNYLYALARLVPQASRAADAPRAPVGADAVLGAGWSGQRKPVVLVMVVGETARAANWGLSGYSRQTTPELAARGDIINFASVSSCGTDTETSLPCMFSPWGRRHYDEARIRGSESLLDVAAHAGFKVVWVDNQSGCKGVCAGVESRRAGADTPLADCRDGQCQDGALLASLEKVIGENDGNLLVVLHQMGNHGPAYFKRYTPEFAHFGPACDDADLARCPREAIVNAYDNALRYTDHLLAATVGLLAEQNARNAAMLYVSDHGESLGENGLYLHGVPYAIAPEVQTRVPMVMWLSAGYRAAFTTDAVCLATRAQQPASHDHLFHTVLGMLDIRTAAYESDMDFAAGCRTA